MTFRARLLAGALIVALLPLAGVAVLVRSEVRETIAELDEARIAADAGRVARALEAQVADLDDRLDGLARQLPEENAVRLALLGTFVSPGILVEFPRRILPGTGLDALWILDAQGKVLASSVLPGDTGRVARGWVAQPDGEPAVADVETPQGAMRVLAAGRSLRLEQRSFTLVAGRLLDPILESMGRGPVAVTFAETAPPPAAAVRTIPIDVVRFGVWSEGAFELVHDPADLEATLARLDRLFLLVGLGSAALALLASLLLARGISAPIEQLAEQTGRIDLERLEIAIHPGRTDELGQLERTLAALVARLKASVSTLRDVERRAAVGDVARQVNHDIKNGLVPIRNVLRHLVETAEREPGRTAHVLLERRGTIEASVSYLEQLAANYARLTPAVTGGTTDLAEVVRNAVDAVSRDGIAFHTDVRGDVRVAGERVAVRRVVENLVGNARDAARGAVTVACAGENGRVIMEVTDDGPGMTEEQLERAFTGFHTTKPAGTGLGLTVVRRVVQDLGGKLKVTTEPGQGTTVRVELPSA